MDHRLLFVPMQAPENLIRDHPLNHLRQTNLFRQQETEKAHHDQDHVPSLILLNLERQVREMVRNHQRIRIILQNQAQDLQVLLILHPEVLRQRRGIIHVPDLDPGQIR